MKIYLLRVDRERHFFYSDVAENPDLDEDESEPSHLEGTGPRAWVQRRVAKFRQGWDHAATGPMHWMRGLWNWLHSFAHPDESMLVRLRTARRVSLHYPASLSEAQVSDIWRGYLGRQWTWHWAWLLINGTVAPFTIVLALLPGPNVIGYWFLYRAVHHALVVWGIGRIRYGQLVTKYDALEPLDQPIEHDADGKASHPVLQAGAVALDEHVARRQSAS